MATDPLRGPSTKNVAAASEAPPSATVAIRARPDGEERARLFTKLAEADRLLALGTLAAGVAHEINTPLAYLLMNLELVARELEPLGEAGAATAALADALEGAARITTIVRELRAVSAAPRDRLCSVDVRAVVASTARVADHEIRPRARLVTSFPPDLPDVLADPSRLGQVLLNLVINAAQALPEGAPTRHEIRIGARAVADERVAVTVEDTGPGIPEEILPRVFEPFFTTKPSGTGLGLAVCRRLVDALGGRIDAANAPGGGAKITVTLPAAPTTSRESTPAPERAPRRVLLLDDEANFGRLVASLLRPDHEVTAVTRAKDALALLAGGSDFDAILCDLSMPEMNGPAFHEAIAAVRPELGPRIVFMTGGTFTTEASAFLERVDNPRLHKPFATAALLEAIAAAAGDD